MLLEVEDDALRTGAAGLGGAESSLGVLARELFEPSMLMEPSMDVSTSARERGVSGGFASVEMSDKASDGVSKPDAEDEFGNAECS